ncbi:MAG TPA: aminotransferase class I/II-fold pyridoxal phosphate-dependent enzyme [Sphaerochaeta sp.]|nr:aminotransferase class I/II-fold pyridoxal phosphate-dependent enzyme [Sphaerochaeta sp.]
MNKPDFDRIIDRRGTGSVKWDRGAITGICGNGDAEPFWVADMDWQAPPAVLQAAHDLADHGIYGYPLAPEQRQVFCRWAEERHNLHLDPAEVVVSQGVLASLATLVEILTSEGDGIIVPLPAYQPFIRIVTNFKRNLLPWPLAYDHQNRRFSLDWEGLESLLPSAKAMIFCSPHNPTGLTFSHDELVALCSLCAKHQVTVISDEIHSDLAFRPHHSLIEAAAGTGCDVIVLMSPSKTFNIAGEHYSLTLFSNSEMRDLFIRRRDQLYGGSVSTTAIALATAAYREGGPHLAFLIDYLRQQARFVEQYLWERVPSLSFIAPQASFIALIDCRGIYRLVEQDAALHSELYNPALSPNGGLLSRFFGQRASVAMNDGTWFGGDAYRHFVRFNFASPRLCVSGALERMANAVDELQKRYS